MKTTCSPLTFFKKPNSPNWQGNCGFHNLHLDAIQSQQSQLRSFRTCEALTFPLVASSHLERWNFTNKQSLTNQILHTCFFFGGGWIFWSFGPVFSKRSLSRNLSQNGLREDDIFAILVLDSWGLTKWVYTSRPWKAFSTGINGCFWFP